MVDVFSVPFCVPPSKLSMCSLFVGRKKGLKCDLTILQKSSLLLPPLVPRRDATGGRRNPLSSSSTGRVAPQQPCMSPHRACEHGFNGSISESWQSAL